VTEKALGETTTYAPDLLYLNGRFERGRALVCDAQGRIAAVTNLESFAERDETTNNVVRLRNRAMLPGMSNAHSHAFQRVIRGRTEYRSEHARDSFWTWREMMYAAASRLTPEDIYDASRMAFLEMALAGITSVGEFHYLHRTASGVEYDDPNLLSKEVVRAARDTGLRIALLRVAYARAGFQRPPDERQRRFIEPDSETFLRNTDALARDLVALESTDAPPSAWVGVAPHSVRAVPLESLRDVCAFASARKFVVHMHVAEQPAEIDACVEETGRTPVALLASEGLLGANFTGVHAVHITPEEVRSLARARACVCACPTTERNLGDGIVPADALFDEGVRLALGTDSHTQIDLLEDARELEYHLRLQRLQRNVLAPTHGARRNTEGRRDVDNEGVREVDNEDVRDDADSSALSKLAARLFECASLNGARSIGADAGEFAAGRAADFFTVDLSDASIAGADEEDLLPSIVFSLSRAAVRDVSVGGRLIVEDGRHAAQDEIVSRFAALQRRLWT
jgi:formimidoylglutamate deiminase